MLTVPIALPLDSLVPAVELFAHPSTLHGQAHVSRVMVHAFRLLEATGWSEEAPRLWAAVYLHDIARTHDGRCSRHGADAMKRLETLPQVRELFSQGGVQDSDYGQIHTAVVHHSLPNELDLDPRRLRNPQAREMIAFAEALFEETDGIVPVGPAHFTALWPEATRLLGH